MFKVSIWGGIKEELERLRNVEMRLSRNGWDLEKVVKVGLESFSRADIIHRPTSKPSQEGYSKMELNFSFHNKVDNGRRRWGYKSMQDAWVCISLRRFKESYDTLSSTGIRDFNLSLVRFKSSHHSRAFTSWTRGCFEGDLLSLPEFETDSTLLLSPFCFSTGCWQHRLNVKFQDIKLKPSTHTCNCPSSSKVLVSTSQFPSSFSTVFFFHLFTAYSLSFLFMFYLYASPFSLFLLSPDFC